MELLVMLAIIFIPLLVFFAAVTTLVIYCNPDFPTKDSLLWHIVNGRCTWEPAAVQHKFKI